MGGSSHFGGGAVGVTGNSNGNNAANYGAGGSGASRGTSGSGTNTGGNGSQGVVVAWEFG